MNIIKEIKLDIAEGFVEEAIDKTIEQAKALQVYEGMQDDLQLISNQYQNHLREESLGLNPKIEVKNRITNGLMMMLNKIERLSNKKNKI